MNKSVVSKENIPMYVLICVCMCTLHPSFAICNILFSLSLLTSSIITMPKPLSQCQQCLQSLKVTNDKHRTLIPTAYIDTCTTYKLKGE